MYLFHDQRQGWRPRYGSVNIVQNDSSRLAGVKLSAVITLYTAIIMGVTATQQTIQ